MANIKNTSKFISLILRHKPETIGISLDEHGWADVQELIAGINASGSDHLDMDLLEEIVRTDEKQRYSFNEDHTLIRANQGHSIPVDVELEEKNPPNVLYHGTGEKYVSSIDEQGLVSKSRLYVHLSADIPTAKKVGSRHGKPVIYTVDCAKMAADGFKFYLSANNVWLTKAVPARYLNKLLIDPNTQQRLWSRTRDDLVRAVEELGFPAELGEAIAKHLGNPKAMERMISYLHYVKPKTEELVVDEMLAIRSEIDAWREKKASEEANARYNEIKELDIFE